MKRRFKALNCIRVAVLLIVCLIVIFPFFWMILGSFKTLAEVSDKNVFFPAVWRYQNYIDAWHQADFPLYFRNSISMAVVSVAMQVITSSMAAYAFAKVRFRLNRPLFMLFLCAMMIPGEATLITNYLTVSSLKLLNTFAGVVCTSFVTVFGIFLLRQTYLSIPDSLTDAAKIDGAGEIRSFFSIILPLGKSGMATIAISGFLGSWNAYQWPTIVANKPALYTVQTGLRAMLGKEAGTRWNTIMAMSTIIALPTLVVFVALQKYYVQGITKAGIK